MAAGISNLAQAIAQQTAASQSNNQPSVSVHGPYEDVTIKALDIIEKLIDGQSPEQKIKIWDNWIRFWQPMVDLMIGAK